MNRPWMPLYIADYLKKTTHLRALESGAYLHLIMAYWASGKLPNDDRQLATIAKVSDREWKALKPTLAAFFGPDWTHARIDEELAKAEEVAASSSERARQAANKRWAKHTTRNAPSMQQASLKDAQECTLHSSQDTKEEKKEASSLRSDVRTTIERAEKEQLKQAKRLPEDWQPSVADIDFAKANGLDALGLLRETTKFKNYWLAKGGKDARKLDWSRTWQNWVLNSGGSGGQGRSRAFQNDELSVSKAIDRQRESGITFGPRPRLLPDDSEEHLRLLPAGRGT
jgi:uncharacterized protein YdaU (DUF1376 family)